MAMINLLPYDQKKTLAAARTNTVLLRYNIILIAAAGFLAIATAVVYFYLTSVQASAEARVQENQRRESSYAQVKQDATDFKSQLDDAQAMFNEDLSYSTALVRFANLFPEGATISQMSLSSESFSKPMELTVRLSGRDAAQALENNMANSPYVSNFKVLSFSYDTSGDNVNWSISFTLSKDIAKL